MIVPKEYYQSIDILEDRKATAERHISAVQIIEKWLTDALCKTEQENILQLAIFKDGKNLRLLTLLVHYMDDLSDLSANVVRVVCILLERFHTELKSDMIVSIWTCCVRLIQKAFNVQNFEVVLNGLHCLSYFDEKNISSVLSKAENCQDIIQLLQQCLNLKDDKLQNEKYDVNSLILYSLKTFNVVLANLVSVQKPETIVDFERCFTAVFQLLFDSNMELRKVSVLSLEALRKLFGEGFHRHQLFWPNLKDDLKNKYSRMLIHFTETNESDWGDLWCLMLELLGTELSVKQNNQLINRLLEVEERAFKSSDMKTRYSAFVCWRYLIKKFLDSSLSDASRRVKLLLQPLVASNARNAELYTIKFTVWWDLIVALEPVMDGHTTIILNYFLNFCFGPFNDTSVRSNSDQINMRKALSVSIGNAKQLRYLDSYSCADALAQILLSDSNSMKYTFKLKRFKATSTLQTSLFVSLSKTIIQSVAECTVFLVNSKECEQSQKTFYLEIIWKNLFIHIKKAVIWIADPENETQGDKSIEIIKDLFRTLLTLVDVSSTNEPLAHVCLVPIMENALLGEGALSEEILKSRSYYVGSDGLMNGTSLFVMLDIFLTPCIAVLQKSKIMYMPLIEYIFKLGIGLSESTLPFAQAVIKKLDTLACSNIHSSESTVKAVWCCLAKFLTTCYVGLGRDINQGNKSSCDFKCIYMVLMFPVSFATIFSTGQEKVKKIWCHLLQAIHRNISVNEFRYTISVNELCETLCQKIKYDITKKGDIPCSHMVLISSLISSVTDLVPYGVIKNFFSDSKIKLPEKSFQMSICFSLLQKCISYVKKYSEEDNMIKCCINLANCYITIFKNIENANFFFRYVIEYYLEDIHFFYKINISNLPLSKTFCSTIIHLWELCLKYADANLRNAKNEDTITSTMNSLSPLINTCLTHSVKELRERTSSFVYLTRNNDDIKIVEVKLANHPGEKQQKSPKADNSEVVKLQPPTFRHFQSPGTGTSPVMKKERPLTKHQIEIMRKRRDDIPALYMDLTQDSQPLTSDFSQDSSQSLDVSQSKPLDNSGKGDGKITSFTPVFKQLKMNSEENEVIQIDDDSDEEKDGKNEMEVEEIKEITEIVAEDSKEHSNIKCHIKKEGTPESVSLGLSNRERKLSESPLKCSPKKSTSDLCSLKVNTVTPTLSPSVIQNQADKDSKSIFKTNSPFTSKAIKNNYRTVSPREADKVNSHDLKAPVELQKQKELHLDVPGLESNASLEQEGNLSKSTSYQAKHSIENAESEVKSPSSHISSTSVSPARVVLKRLDVDDIHKSNVCKQIFPDELSPKESVQNLPLRRKSERPKKMDVVAAKKELKEKRQRKKSGIHANSIENVDKCMKINCTSPQSQPVLKGDKSFNDETEFSAKKYTTQENTIFSVGSNDKNVLLKEQVSIANSHQHENIGAEAVVEKDTKVNDKTHEKKQKGNMSQPEKTEKIIEYSNFQKAGLSDNSEKLCNALPSKEMEGTSVSDESQFSESRDEKKHQESISSGECTSSQDVKTCKKDIKNIPVAKRCIPDTTIETCIEIGSESKQTCEKQLKSNFERVSNCDSSDDIKNKRTNEDELNTDLPASKVFVCSVDINNKLDTSNNIKNLHQKDETKSTSKNSQDVEQVEKCILKSQEIKQLSGSNTPLFKSLNKSDKSPYESKKVNTKEVQAKELTSKNGEDEIKPDSGIAESQMEDVSGINDTVSYETPHIYENVSATVESTINIRTMSASDVRNIIIGNEDIDEVGQLPMKTSIINGCVSNNRIISSESTKQQNNDFMKLPSTSELQKIEESENKNLSCKNVETLETIHASTINDTKEKNDKETCGKEENNAKSVENENSKLSTNLQKVTEPEWTEQVELLKQLSLMPFVESKGSEEKIHKICTRSKMVQKMSDTNRIDDRELIEPDKVSAVDDESGDDIIENSQESTVSLTSNFTKRCFVKIPKLVLNPGKLVGDSPLVVSEKLASDSYRICNKIDSHSSDLPDDYTDESMPRDDYTNSADVSCVKTREIGMVYKKRKRNEEEPFERKRKESPESSGSTDFGLNTDEINGNINNDLSGDTLQGNLQINTVTGNEVSSVSNYVESQDVAHSLNESDIAETKENNFSSEQIDSCSRTRVHKIQGIFGNVRKEHSVVETSINIPEIQNTSCTSKSNLELAKQLQSDESCSKVSNNILEERNKKQEVNDITMQSNIYTEDHNYHEDSQECEVLMETSIVTRMEDFRSPGTKEERRERKSKKRRHRESIYGLKKRRKHCNEDSSTENISYSDDNCLITYCSDNVDKSESIDCNVIREGTKTDQSQALKNISPDHVHSFDSYSLLMNSVSPSKMKLVRRTKPDTAHSSLGRAAQLVGLAVKENNPKRVECQRKFGIFSQFNANSSAEGNIETVQLDFNKPDEIRDLQLENNEEDQLGDIICTRDADGQEKQLDWVKCIYSPRAVDPSQTILRKKSCQVENVESPKKRVSFVDPEVTQRLFFKPNPPEDKSSPTHYSVVRTKKGKIYFRKKVTHSAHRVLRSTVKHKSDASSMFWPSLAECQDSVEKIICQLTNDSDEKHILLFALQQEKITTIGQLCSLSCHHILRLPEYKKKFSMLKTVLSTYEANMEGRIAEKCFEDIKRNENVSSSSGFEDILKAHILKNGPQSFSEILQKVLSDIPNTKEFESKIIHSLQKSSDVLHTSPQVVPNIHLSSDSSIISSASPTPPTLSATESLDLSSAVCPISSVTSASISPPSDNSNDNIDTTIKTTTNSVSVQTNVASYNIVSTSTQTLSSLVASVGTCTPVANENTTLQETDSCSTEESILNKFKNLPVSEAQLLCVNAIKTLLEHEDRTEILKEVIQSNYSSGCETQTENTDKSSIASSSEQKCALSLPKETQDAVLNLLISRGFLSDTRDNTNSETSPKPKSVHLNKHVTDFIKQNIGVTNLLTDLLTDMSSEDVLKFSADITDFAVNELNASARVSTLLLQRLLTKKNVCLTVQHVPVGKLLGTAVSSYGFERVLNALCSNYETTPETIWTTMIKHYGPALSTQHFINTLFSTNESTENTGSNIVEDLLSNIHGKLSPSEFTAACFALIQKSLEKT